MMMVVEVVTVVLQFRRMERGRRVTMAMRETASRTWWTVIRPPEEQGGAARV